MRKTLAARGAEERRCKFCGKTLIRVQRGKSIEPLRFFVEREFCNAECSNAYPFARAGLPVPPKRIGYGMAGAQAITGSQSRSRAPGRRSAREMNLAAGPAEIPELDPEDWRLVVYGGVQIVGTDRRRYPPKNVRTRIAEKQNNTCLYCELPIGTVISRRKELIRLVANWDHFVPYAYSSRNANANWVLACHVCNGIKSARVFDTVQQARLLILPVREAKGYESPLAVMARLGLADGEGREGPESHAEGLERENTRGDGSEAPSVALPTVLAASGGFGDGNPHAKAAEA